MALAAERLKEWIGRFAGSLRGGRSDADLEDELRAHLELAIDAEGGRSGSGRDAGRRQRIRAGGMTQSLDALRDQRGVPWLDDLARDVRYGCRMLAQHRGFTLVAVLSLAIGIGANCAVFSFADALLLRPLSVPRPGAIVTVGSPVPLGSSLASSYRDYLDIRDRSHSFDGLVAYTSSTVAFAADPNAVPTARIGMLVSGNFFQALDVVPQAGRAFRDDENRVPGRDAVIVLGHDFWATAFAADPSVLGRRVRMNGVEFTVIGVAPQSFTGLDRFTRFEFFAPLMMAPRLSPDANVAMLEARDSRRLTLKGRLRDGASVVSAQSELSTIARDLERTYPDTNRSQRLVVRTELQDRFAESGPNVALTAMLGFLAAAVLFVACANVAGLLASRAPLRAREIALRLAIGAGRRRVVRQLVTESFIISAIGGMLGVAIGYAGVLLFRQFRIPTSLPIAVSFRLDSRALAVSLVVALASAVLFGLAPALRAARTDLTAVMKASDTGGFGQQRHWGRASLVAGQVAIAVVLLAVAAFIYNDFHQRLARGPGFRRDHMLMMWFDPTMLRYTDGQSRRFFDEALRRIRELPGVRAAALTSFMPMDGGTGPVTIAPEGFQFPPGRENATVLSAAIDDQFLAMLEVPIVKGRGFRETDDADAPRVAIVNEQVAEHFFPGQDPIGKRFRLGDPTGWWVEIVGVAKTIAYSFLIEPPRDYIYFPYRQRPTRAMALVAESAGDPAALAAPLREMIHNLDPGQPIHNLRTVEEMYRMRVVAIMNVLVTLIGAMGIMGLMLAFVGLYGLVAFSVSRRTKEIGIRIAIGAHSADILRMVLSRGMLLALAGLSAGLLASVAAGRAMAAIFQAQETGSRPAGGVAFAVVAAIVLAVTATAAYVPARRAARVNPMEALRNE